MDMDFEIVRGVQFGFDVGGSYLPPEPGEDVGVLNGTAALVFSGSLTELTDIEIISGMAEMEE